VIKLIVFLVAVLLLGYLIHWIVDDITGRSCNDKSSKHMLDSLVSINQSINQSNQSIKLCMPIIVMFLVFIGLVDKT
jgi:hypothetical protein